MASKQFTNDERTRIATAKSVADSEFSLQSLGPGEGPAVDDAAKGFWLEHPLTQRLIGYLAEKLVSVRERNEKKAIVEAMSSGSILPEFVAMDVLKSRGHAEAIEYILGVFKDIKAGTK